MVMERPMLKVELIEISRAPMSQQPMELVERKGLGHPDFMCDAMMEAISVGLCQAYMDVCGRVLHHNIDKGLLVAGQSVPKPRTFLSFIFNKIDIA
jgi:S-adenosylmethionine synthetase